MPDLSIILNKAYPHKNLFNSLKFVARVSKCTTVGKN